MTLFVSSSIRTGLLLCRPPPQASEACYPNSTQADPSLLVFCCLGFWLTKKLITKIEVLRSLASVRDRLLVQLRSRPPLRGGAAGTNGETRRERPRPTA